MNTDLDIQIETDEVIEDIKNLIVFNDNVNTFQHVISCLVKYCKHTTVQAEQCAYIIHNSGKCNVKSGSYEELETIAETLSNRNLTVEIQ